ncbi:hypothetical protein NDU88_005335 [Pleurodeles waltl]|uniref:Uncharacterized protein n=1 Tax=Pleurodeles waltl TaxID=8319 RepID=A0AAV7SLE2_PLEWA|nr:hypothetical protein NDU88_005335 [Pleurodeles waltl]
MAQLGPPPLRGQARPETREARARPTVSAHLLSGVRGPGPSSTGINRRSCAVLLVSPTNWRAPTCIGASACCRFPHSYRPDDNPYIYVDRNNIN